MSRSFFNKKKRAQGEINVNHLPEHLKSRFTGPKGSRWKEWAAIIAVGSDGTKAVRVHRGAAAAENCRTYPRRIMPPRWRGKWDDTGADYNDMLDDPTVPESHDSKFRWTIQGFHDPDIAVLSRTVPTPSTSDVPLALQCLSSIKSKAWVGDV